MFFFLISLNAFLTICIVYCTIILYQIHTMLRSVMRSIADSRSISPLSQSVKNSPTISSVDDESKHNIINTNNIFIARINELENKLFMSSVSKPVRKLTENVDRLSDQYAAFNEYVQHIISERGHAKGCESPMGSSSHDGRLERSSSPEPTPSEHPMPCASRHIRLPQDHHHHHQRESMGQGQGVVMKRVMCIRDWASEGDYSRFGASLAHDEPK